MNASWETAQAVESYRSRCEDRAAVFREEGRVVIVVADGAGGVGHALPRQLAELVRWSSGSFADDVAVVACRAIPKPHTRQRYEI